MIPGTSKPALLKPGAEKLCNFFGLEPEFTPVVDEIDWTGTQHGGETFCYVRYRCRLFRHSRILGVGEGSCNSWESRYRYRWVAAEQVPEYLDRTRMLKRGGHRKLCEFEFAIERAETTGVYGKPAEYWQKFKEAITAGTARQVERDTRQGKSPAWEIDVDATLYRIPNPDVADLVNTIQKMAQKPCHGACQLTSTSFAPVRKVGRLGERRVTEGGPGCRGFEVPVTMDKNLQQFRENLTGRQLPSWCQVRGYRSFPIREHLATVVAIREGGHLAALPRWTYLRVLRLGRSVFLPSPCATASLFAGTVRHLPRQDLKSPVEHFPCA